VCKFCGRAVCKEHAKEMPFILTIYDEDEDIPKAIVVADAIWCQQCKPQPSPIGMPEID
jgi:hypothetical protein